MAVYGINYNGGDKNDLSYKSVRILYGENEEKLFNSGNFVKDWFDLVKFIINELSETESHFVGSSDVDQFFLDGGDKLYDKAYLNTTNSASELKYKLVDWDSIKFYVNAGTQPTWEELKEICK